MRRYLQLTRAHTAPLEAIPAIFGAILATGSVGKPVLLWGIFGVLYHLAGYGHNSYADYYGYDEDDPFKQHHPMNTGGDKFRLRAEIFTYSLIGITFVYATWLVYPSVLAFGLGVLMLILGLAYNFFGKRTESKFIIIALAHSLVFVLPYISLGGEINGVFVGSWLFVLLWVVYQIAISGELKDLEAEQDTDEENLMVDMGVEKEVYSEGVFKRKEKSLHVPLPVSTFMSLINISLLTVAVLVALQFGLDGSQLLIIMVIAIVGVVRLAFENAMLERGFVRGERIKYMSLIEFTSLTIFCIMLIPVAGLEIAFLAVAGSLLWVLFFNYLEWGTFISPRV